MEASVILLYFFLMFRPHPRSTLFPYTTLFRSWRSPSAGDGPCSRTTRRLAESPGNWAIRDRKSTRLNSSHANISYAVFCLKKKQHRREPNQVAHSTLALMTLPC